MLSITLLACVPIFTVFDRGSHFGESRIFL